MSESAESFTKLMRKTTRDVHKLSDDLVNAKLAFALHDNKVWADGLLVFYEIFRFLEEHVSADILPPEYHRTAALEDDLAYYLGPDWKKSYEIRPEVGEYLKHLRKIQHQNPTLLVAYVYHLYMGLLSGGQILQKKRNLAQKINPFACEQQHGVSVTCFVGHTIGELKQQMRDTIDNLAEGFNDDLKQELIEEGRNVFALNNRIVRSVRGVNRVNLRLLVYLLLILLAAYVYFVMWRV